MVKLFYKVLVNFFLYITHGKFLIGIFADFGNPCTAGFDIILANVLNGNIVKFFQLVVIQNASAGLIPGVKKASW